MQNVQPALLDEFYIKISVVLLAIYFGLIIEIGICGLVIGKIPCSTKLYLWH